MHRIGISYLPFIRWPLGIGISLNPCRSEQVDAMIGGGRIQKRLIDHFLGAYRDLDSEIAGALMTVPLAGRCLRSNELFSGLQGSDIVKII